jgi:acetyl esterase/lipase
LHDYANAAQAKGENPLELEDRMADFRRAIAAALDEDVAEVLVVGHSSGAHLAVSILAELIREGGVSKRVLHLVF